MAVTVTHPFVSPVVDAGNANEVGPNEWNASHTVTGLGTAAEADAGDFVLAANMALFMPQDYGAVGDGTTNDSAAFADMMTAVYTNKGGVIYVPYTTAGYALGSAWSIDVGQYAAGSGITVYLNGSVLKPSHNDWCIDVATNFFGANNGGNYGQKRVKVEGDGAKIVGTAGGSGGVRLTDTVKCAVSDIDVESYTVGTALQLYVSVNDQSRWSEENEITGITWNGCLNGFYTRSFTTANASNSFKGNRITACAGNMTVNNGKAFNLEGALGDCQFDNPGGWYNQSGVTGCSLFYLNGAYWGALFNNAWADLGSSIAGDIVFGASFTATVQYFPSFLNVSKIALPVGWESKLRIIGPYGRLVTDAANPESREFYNQREVIGANRTYYVRSDGADTHDGLANTAAGAFLTVAAALTAAAQIDCNGFDVTIQVADGTWTTAVVVTKTPLGVGTFTLKGASSAGLVLSTTSADALKVTNGVKLTISNMDLRTTTSGSGLRVEDISTKVTISSGVQFGVCATRHMIATIGGQISVNSAFTFSGNAPIGIEAGPNALVYVGAVMTGSNRAFASNFAYVYDNGVLVVTSAPVTTSSTGSRGYVAAGGLIETFGGGATFLPGNVDVYAEAGQFAQYL